MTERTAHSLTLLIVIVGVACRLAQYVANTSVWHDEAFVALNVRHTSFVGLLGPLDWHEPSPPGFLLAEKVLVLWLGESEYSLRLLPLLAGVVALVAFAGLARDVSGNGPARLWALLLLAASTKLVIQSAEIKHFTLDLLSTVVLSRLTLSVLRHPSSLALLAWGLLGALAMWFSYASVFVCTGTSVILAWWALRQGSAAERAVYTLMNVVMLASFALLLVPIHAQRSAAVTAFWTRAFPDFTHVWQPVLWMARALLGMFDWFWQPMGVLIAALVAAGARRCWLTDRVPLAVLWMPVVVALLTAFAHRWPFGGNQHMSFAAPAVLLTVAEGIEALRPRLRAWRFWAPAAALTVLLLPGAAPSLYRLVEPHRRHEFRPVIEFMQAHRQPGDQLMVFDPATFEFYTGTDLRGAAPPKDPSQRIWVLFTGGAEPPPVVGGLLETLAQQRPQLQVIRAHGAAGYLFGAHG